MNKDLKKIKIGIIFPGNHFFNNILPALEKNLNINIYSVLCRNLRKKKKFKNIKHIHFPYEASVQKRVEIYNLADIFICTSIEDSGPSTLTEVMSCGIPVVAFDTGDAQKYIVNNYNGYKVRLKDVTDLENKIFKIFSLKKAEIDLFSKNSRNFVLNNLNKDKQLIISKGYFYD